MRPGRRRRRAGGRIRLGVLAPWERRFTDAFRSADAWRAAGISLSSRPSGRAGLRRQPNAPARVAHSINIIEHRCVRKVPRVSPRPPGRRRLGRKRAPSSGAGSCWDAAVVVRLVGGLNSLPGVDGGPFGRMAERAGHSGPVSLQAGEVGGWSRPCLWPRQSSPLSVRISTGRRNCGSAGGDRQPDSPG